MRDGDVIPCDSDIYVLNQLGINYFLILKRLSVKTHILFEGEFGACNF